ncbi:PH domain-containing protein [Psychroserpens sp. Hel_I_66]|uniref:PH domain-containing protein n=1 Tax=Psychroserpens sp. Hel_I_66 TaxID=1250004 RepID=UPI00068E3BEC|nr:PH domain-containing protein [Psychroserpens sp. Hel_I_66]
MNNCSVCSVKLKFINTPTFGAGKLNDGSVICTSCYKKINKINPSIAFKLKKHSLTDIQNLLQEKEETDSTKNEKLNEIKAEIKSLNLSNVSTFFGRKEINELPQILAENEKIDHIIQGTYNNGNGILVSTNRRLVFIDKGMIYGLKVEDFPLEKISSIQYETGLILGKVKIHTSGNIASIDNVEKASSRIFAEFVRDKLSKPKEPIAQNSQEPNVLEQLEKLGKLKDSGILTETEFSEQKAKLLEKL